jgi:hypothetical protein
VFSIRPHVVLFSLFYLVLSLRNIFRGF